jgi:uncharacterized membrane protein YkvA (DUF1232 family)
MSVCMETKTDEQTFPLEQRSAMLPVKPGAIKDKLRESIEAFVHDIVFLYRLLRHPMTPWYVRGLLALPVMYLCSPIQLIPNFIPVLGQMDDVFVMWVTKKIALNLVDEKTWQECHGAAVATMLPFQSKRTRHAASPIGYLRPESNLPPHQHRRANGTN